MMTHTAHTPPYQECVYAFTIVDHALSMPSSTTSYQAVKPLESEHAENEDKGNEAAHHAAHLELDQTPVDLCHAPIDEASAHSLTESQAMIHLVKGNLGPGCLNLPRAFAKTGWGLSIGLFGLVAAQGIYSMCLLVYCKKALKGPKTFMDVAQVSLGTTGSYIVEGFLVILQGGVCCVFLSLVSTNLVALFESMSDLVAVILVTSSLLVIVLLRFIKDLTWLSATANGFMVIAIATASIAGLMHFFGRSADETTGRVHAANPSPENIVNFVSDMFFAFEGIGLVLPIENSYTLAEGRERKASFDTVLVRSMSIAAGLFVCVGLSASISFPDIRSGSITAYLQEQYPSNMLFAIVDTLVMVAVLFTFPLQLNPAMEVIDRWTDQGCARRPRPVRVALSTDESREEEEGDNYVREPTNCEQDSIVSCESLALSPLDTRCCWIKQWIWRRWVVVLFCAIVVYSVDNLSVLIALFGAIGQTGLAGMPCAIHLALQRKAIVPKSIVRTALDVFILLFCFIVMVSGLVAYFVG